MNMKRSTWLIMIFALFLVGSTDLVGQTSAAEVTLVVGDDIYNGTVLPPFPTITCPGGEPTGDLTAPCTEGSRIHTRDYTILTVFDTTSELVTGWATITINANFDADGNGPAWGTISIEPYEAEGGTWDGTWQGVRVQKQPGMWVIPVHASLRGNGGLVDRMLYRAVDIITNYTLVVGPYQGVIEGRILDPHKK